MTSCRRRPLDRRQAPRSASPGRAPGDPRHRGPAEPWPLRGGREPISGAGGKLPTHRSRSPAGTSPRNPVLRPEKPPLTAWIVVPAGLWQDKSAFGFPKSLTTVGDGDGRGQRHRVHRPGWFRNDCRMNGSTSGGSWPLKRTRIVGVRTDDRGVATVVDALVGSGSHIPDSGRAAP